MSRFQFILSVVALIILWDVAIGLTDLTLLGVIIGNISGYLLGLASAKKDKDDDNKS